MGYCQNCGTFNREGSKFCNECGWTLVAALRRCPVCDSPNVERNRFCGGCGRLLPTLTPALQEDRPASTATTAPLPEISGGFTDVDDEELPALEADVPLAGGVAARQSLPSDGTIDESVHIAMTLALGEDREDLTVEDRAFIVWYGALSPEEQLVSPSEGQTPAIPSFLARKTPPSPALTSVAAEPAAARQVDGVSDQADGLILVARTSTTEESLPAKGASEVPSFAGGRTLPDWLEAEEPAERPAAPSASASLVDRLGRVQEPAAQLPDWLVIEEPTQGLPVPEVITAPLPELNLPPSALDLPNWPGAAESPSAAPPPSEQMALPQIALKAEPLPEWLFIAESDQSSEATAPPGSGVVAEAEAVAFREASVLAKVVVDAPPVTRSVRPVQETPGVADFDSGLPDWLFEDDGGTNVAAGPAAGRPERPDRETAAAPVLGEAALSESSGQPLLSAVGTGPAPALVLPDWLEMTGEPQERGAVEGLEPSAVTAAEPDRPSAPQLPEWLETEELVVTEPPRAERSEILAEGEVAAPPAPKEETEEAPILEPVAAGRVGPMAMNLPDWLFAEEESKVRVSRRPEETVQADVSPVESASPEPTATMPEPEVSLEPRSLPDWLWSEEPAVEVHAAPVKQEGTEATDQPTEPVMVAVAKAGQADQETLAQVEPELDVSLPDWLVSPTEVGQATTSAAEAGSGQLSGELNSGEATPPEWLQMAEDTDSRTMAEPSSGGLTHSAEESARPLPDWLQEERPPDERRSAPENPESGVAEQPTVLPDWLSVPEKRDAGESSMQSAGESPAESTAVTAETETDEPVCLALPDWLGADEPEQTAVAASEAPKVGDEPELPSAASPAASDQETVSSPQSGDLPDWLLMGEDGGSPVGPSATSPDRENEPPTPVGEGKAGTVVPFETEPSVSFVVDLEHSRRRQGLVATDDSDSAFAAIVDKEDLPQWLSGEGPSTDETGAPSNADEPSDVAEEPAPVAASPGSEQGQLDVSGITLAKTFQVVRFPGKSQSGEAPKQGYAEIFSDVLVPETQVRVQKAGKPSWIAPRLIALFMVLAVLVPFLVPAQNRQIPSSGAVSAAHDTVDRLPLGSAVLVSFDWNGALNDEMMPIARTAVRHLANRQAKIIAVSTVPEGGKLAQLVMDQELAGKNYVYGRDYVILGYYPGDETAVRILLSDVPAGSYQADFFGRSTRDLTLVQKVADLEDLSLVVDIAGDPGAMGRWVRQLNASDLFAKTGTKMVGFVSALGGPEMNTYVKSGQLAGLVAGVRGAAQYDGRNANPGTFLDAQSYGTIVIVLCVAAGNLAYLFQRSRKRPARASGGG